MKMENSGASYYIILGFLLTGLLWGCNSSRSYRAKYEAAWQQVVQSDAWKQSLQDNGNSQEYLEVSQDSESWLTDSNSFPPTDDPFYVKYDSWVSRAYFKIIAEAEAADVQIKAEYDRFLAENPDAAASSDKNLSGMLELYQKKYRAHSTMLEGLRSWQAFEEYGSDDLQFFKAEHEDVIRAMYRNDEEDKSIVNYLMYKLADLYHLESVDTP